MPLFHCAEPGLLVDHVIEPGKYGRLVLEAGPNGPHFAREATLELIRRTRYPQKPSRLNACFACRDEATARGFRELMVIISGWSATQIYEVEKTIEDAPEHRTDWNMIQTQPHWPETMEQIAELYWSAGRWVKIKGWPDLRCEEIITSSPLRIIRAIPD